jgi:hypothetical protein
MLWFIRQLCLRVGVSFAVLRTDGGGELWGSLAFRNRLLKEAHCIIEPTGAYNSAANGLVEQGIGVVCVQAQICLFASGLNVTFWCFALSHAAMLCNYCPRIDTHTSSHEVLFRDKPNYANLAIWGLPVYVVNRCLTRRRPESATVTGRFLGYAGSHHIITYKNDLTGAIQYAHHTAIDKLDLQNLPGDRGPAAKFLLGIIPDACHELELRQAIADLTLTLSPWLSDRLVSHHVPYDVTCNVLGVVTEADPIFEQLRLVTLTPGSPAARYLGDKNVLDHIIITMNGIRIRSITDIQHILHDYHGNLDDKRGPAFLTGITILFGKPDNTAPEPDHLDFTAHDYATARVVWALIAESSNDALENLTPSPTVSHLSTSSHSIGDQSHSDKFYHATGGGTDAQKAIDEMDKALFPQPDDDIIAYIQSIIVSSMDLDDDVPLDDIIAFVQSIMASDLNPICPKFWHHAMKDPAHKSC